MFRNRNLFWDFCWGLHKRGLIVRHRNDLPSIGPTLLHWNVFSTSCFLNGPFLASFFFLFNTVYSKQMLNIYFANDWIWTMDLCYWKAVALPTEPQQPLLVFCSSYRDLNGRFSTSGRTYSKLFWNKFYKWRWEQKINELTFVWIGLPFVQMMTLSSALIRKKACHKKLKKHIWKLNW